VLPGLWLFAPGRESQGGSSWWLESEHLDLLIDCPALTEANLQFLVERVRRRPSGGEGHASAWIVLTGRDGHGRCRSLQQALGWPVLVQEQEAYLLPGVDRLAVFAEEHCLHQGMRLLWTPGPSPGTCVLHVEGSAAGGRDGLFCGRLLVPVGPGHLAPLRSRRCFHWPRQLRSIAKLSSWLPEGAPDWIATGAPLGALRGEKLVREGARLLAELDLGALEGTMPVLSGAISSPPPGPTANSHVGDSG
jgi:hypothetical protein